MGYKNSDYDYIKNNWKTMTDEEIGAKLKRTAFAIAKQRWKLNLSRVCANNNADYRVISRLNRLKNAVKMSKTINRMSLLIICCENTSNNYKKDKYKAELKKLSGLSKY